MKQEDENTTENVGSLKKRKLCKNKKPHQFEFVREHKFITFYWHEFKCSVCGKKSNLYLK